MTKSSMAKDGARFSTQKIHALLLLILGLYFVALGFKSYPAFIIVGCLFVLVSYRGYTATLQAHKPSDSDPK